MPVWHLILIAMAALSAALSIRSTQCRIVGAQAILSLAGMVLAMSVARPLVAEAAVFALILGAVVPVASYSQASHMKAHRGVSCLVMALVIAGLSAQNNGQICGGIVVPLITLSGIPQLPLPFPAWALVHSAVFSIAAYAVYSAVLASRRLRTVERAEAVLMAVAAIGMALPAPISVNV